MCNFKPYISTFKLSNLPETYSLLKFKDSTYVKLLNTLLWALCFLDICIMDFIRRSHQLCTT